MASVEAKYAYGWGIFILTYIKGTKIQVQIRKRYINKPVPLLYLYSIKTVPLFFYRIF